jgi:hypothetical protein
MDTILMDDGSPQYSGYLTWFMSVHTEALLLLIIFDNSKWRSNQKGAKTQKKYMEGIYISDWN